jgi:hypothetical protein
MRRCAMKFQKSQPAETGHECLFSASAGSLKIMDALLPARKAHTHEIHEKKLAAYRRLANCHGPYLEI